MKSRICIELLILLTTPVSLCAQPSFKFEENLSPSWDESTENYNYFDQKYTYTRLKEASMKNRKTFASL